MKDERGIEDVDWDISSVDDLSFSGCERNTWQILFRHIEQILFRHIEL